MGRTIELVFTIPLDEADLNLIKNAIPNIRIRVHPGKKVDEIPVDVWEKAEILYTERVLPTPEMVPNLKWVQFHYAGIDFAVNNPLLHKDGITITTQSGSSASQVAEYIIMMLLALGHRLPAMMQHQQEHSWPPKRWELFRPQELRESTIGLVGYGSIGRQVARLLQPFGVKIMATKRDMMHPEDPNYSPEGMGDPNGDFFTRLYPTQAIKSMIKECDFIVITMPLTPNTKHLIGAEELAACKPTAYLINASRGEIIDEAALVTALNEKKLGGAALDVFSQEPLPPEHALWNLPNVIITPHIAGNSPLYTHRSIQLFVENLTRYQNGSPLFNVFDPDQQY